MARAMLMCVASDQVALDKGSWLVAWEMVLEEKPPYHSFDAHRQTSETLPHSRLVDERHLEIILARIKALEELYEKRKKLEARTKPGYKAPEIPAEDGGVPPKPRGKGGRGGKGKGKVEE